MMKEDNYYEPIYSYTIKEKLDIITIFEEGGSKISPTMKRVLNEIIKPFFNTICRPLDSMPNVYKAKRSIALFKLINELEKIKYKLEKLVVNFNNKVIGVIAEEPKTKRSGFVPCYPSSIPENEEVNNIIFMNDLSIWKSYNTTVLFLNNLVKKSGLRREQHIIPCKPIFKIVEDEWVVGVLTETNQFIQLSKPVTVLDADDDFKLPSIKNNNYIINKNINKNTNPLIQIDIPVSTNNDIDEERVEYIEKTKMETNFYNIFRNTIRILLNDYENVKIRERIEKELSREYIIYSEKLQIIDELLKTLVNNVIQFTGNETYYKLLTQLYSSIVKNKKQCESTPNLCTFTKKNGRCNLILPKKNLITKNENKPIYFKRMADELIRYSRINTFMLQPQTYLSFGNIGYNLNDNEIIMIQSLLTQEYFETLVPAVINKYTKYNSYDEAEPSMSQIYDNNPGDETCGVAIINPHITSGIWKKCFPNNFKEIEYNKKKSCTFQFIIDLIEKHTGVKLTVNKIKNELYNEYKQYLDKYHDKIVDILIIEGKNLLGKEYQEKVKLGKIDFLTFITSEKYYFLTTLDLWILVQKYKIPTIFISQSCILQTNYEKSAFLGYGDNEDNFAFIILPGFSDKNIPNYKIVQSDKGEIFIPLRDINCIEKINEIIYNKISVEEYLEDFTKNSKTIYHKKTKCKELEEPLPNKKESRKIIIENDEIIQPQPQPESNRDDNIETIIEDDFVKQSSEKTMLKKGTKEKKNKDGICVKK